MPFKEEDIRRGGKAIKNILHRVYVVSGIVVILLLAFGIMGVVLLAKALY